ncbi:SMC family ATPase [Sesbania bispinosa]|nr:SMC family ATPase [Sesbania bispinosa]
MTLAFPILQQIRTRSKMKLSSLNHNPQITTIPTRTHRMVQRPKLTIKPKPTPITSPTNGTSPKEVHQQVFPNLEWVNKKGYAIHANLGLKEKGSMICRLGLLAFIVNFG